MPSDSAVVSDTVTGYHVFTVTRAQRRRPPPPSPPGEHIKSRPFTVGDHPWRIKYYPNDHSVEDAEFISVFFILDKSVVDPLKARVKLSLLVREGRNPVRSYTRDTKVQEYSVHGSGFGFNNFIKRDRPAPSPRVVVPPSDLNRHLNNLLADEDGFDVSFQVAGEMIRAHRCILRVRSPVLKAKLFGAMRESTAAAGELDKN
ncbi:hypothetical protein QOZ80_2BG0180890 [Eleusine coracana subsp. coracana]|nr:hypothetical protein QOZ80_2BG0180890 [Eleusine coracana subsp. coracana]